MTPEHPFLLIGDHCKHCRYLSNIFNFMEIPINTTKPNEWSKLYDDRQIYSFIVCGFMSSDDVNNTLTQISDNCTELPLMMLGKIKDDLPDNLVDQLPAPLSKSRLLQALQRAQTYRDNLPHQHFAATHPDLNNLIGESQAMQDLRQVITQVASSDTSVLILGESGTGKDVVASSIHKLSNRNKKSFVPVNCGAIPADLMESELFGHEKGAFTGALNKRQGRFELANSGTLFLDEIGDMPLTMQVKLLRVLQERQFERVGGNESINVDVRIIAATNQDLEKSIQKKQFRQDLYYRLNVFPIQVKPLRERAEDVPLLIDFFVQSIGQRLQRHIEFTETALCALSDYLWPGNIRELANFVERMMVLHPSGVVDIKDLDAKFLAEADAHPKTTLQIPHSTPSNVNLKEFMAQTEVSLIQDALQLHQGNVSQAARHLSTGRTTLIEKIRKYKIQYDRNKQDTEVEA